MIDIFVKYVIMWLAVEITFEVYINMSMLQTIKHYLTGRYYEFRSSVFT